MIKQQIFNLIDLLPYNFQMMFQNFTWQEIHIGCSGSQVFRLDLSNGNHYYLFTKKVLREELQREANLYRWLKGKLPVPDVYYFNNFDQGAILIISEIPGLDASDVTNISHPELTMQILGEGLKMIHSVAIMHCPFNQSLSIKLKQAEANVRKGLVDLSRVQPENKHKTAEKIFRKVLQKRPFDEDLVFTHGDFCLPNILIKENRLSGFIDFGSGGIADRYQDLALAIRSIKRNLKGSSHIDQMIELFLRSYGINQIDESKIDFYILLDELF